MNNDCSADYNDCYKDDAATSYCTLTQVDSTDVNAACQVAVYYNANISNNWEVHVNASDETTTVTSFGDSNVNIAVSALAGIAVVESAIDYGTVTPNVASTGVSTSVGNTGNLVVDVAIQGEDMCTNFPTCDLGAEYQIGKAKQKWTQTDGSDFTWESEGHALVQTAGAGDADTNGCANLDIAVRDDATGTGTNENVYWKLKVDADQKAGDYTGENTFITTSSSSCTGTP